MLIRFVHSRDDAVAFFDSFSYRLALKDAAMPTDGLAFVPPLDPGIDELRDFFTLNIFAKSHAYDTP